MGYVSIWMDDSLNALLVSLVALRLTLLEQNALWPSLPSSNKLVSYSGHSRCVHITHSVSHSNVIVEV